jgi:hypothetical protein
MRRFTVGHLAAILALGLLGWALCGAIMFVGMSVIPLQTTLIIHAIGAPIIFAAISWFYFSRLNYSSPLSTAIAFLVIVMAMDFFLVALVINRSLEMFQGLLGTWIPFVLIFLSTYVTGIATMPHARDLGPAP